jgi:hypothetical protein
LKEGVIIITTTTTTTTTIIIIIINSRCEKGPETIEHITGSCTSLANMQYLHRHNNVTKIIHQQIAIDKKLLTMYTPYYKYTVTEVLENQRYKLYWDREVRTDMSFSKQTRYPTV